MIKAVIFDVDGVLVNSFEANLKYHQDMLVKAGYKCPTREEYLNVFHMTTENVIRILTKSKDENEIKKIWQMGRDGVIPYHYEFLTSPKNYETVLKELRKKIYFSHCY